MMLALGLVVMAYEKIKALLAGDRRSAARLKCGLSVPVEEYAIHVQECMKRDRT